MLSRYTGNGVMLLSSPSSPLANRPLAPATEALFHYFRLSPSRGSFETERERERESYDAPMYNRAPNEGGREGRAGGNRE